MSSDTADRHWFIVTRWQQLEAEARVNRIRILAILFFYLVELANYYGFSLGPVQWPALAEVTQSDHRAVTALVVLWLTISVALFLCRQRRFFPRWLIYISVALDLVLLTAVILLRGGPSSSLVFAYFVLLALAATRFNLVLVRFATALAGLCFLYVLGAARWFSMGDPIPRREQIIIVLSLVFTGIVLGQLVRLARKASESYALRSRIFEAGNESIHDEEGESS